MNLADILADHARNRPSHPAIMRGRQIVAYRALDARVAATAGRLHRAGANEGDIVALAMGDTAEHLIVLHALLRLGAIVLPINQAWSDEERAHFCARLGVAAMVGDDKAKPIGGVRSILVDRSWGEAVADPVEAPARRGPRQPAMLLLSSGTTGPPKASLFTHEQLQERFMHYVACFGAHAGDRFMPLNRLSFGMPRNASMTALQLGGTVVIPPAMPRTARDLVDLVTRERITWINLVPVQLRGLLSLADGAAPLLPTLRILNASSAALRAEERRAIRARLTPNLFEGYSATEGGSFTVAAPEDQAAFPDSVGRVIGGVELEIVDDDHRPLPADRSGYVRVRGPALVDRYYNNPEATELAFRDGWFYPGDLGRLNADGYLFLAGRRDDVINRDGIKINPIDVEAALLDHPAVAEAAVVGIRNPNLSDVPVGFVVLRQEIDEAGLIAFCRQKLSGFEVPARIFKLSQLPKTATGKIQKNRLRDALQARQPTDRPAGPDTI